MDRPDPAIDLRANRGDDIHSLFVYAFANVSNDEPAIRRTEL